MPPAGALPPPPTRRSLQGMPSFNWHSVSMAIGVLLVECKVCSRRRKLETTTPQIHQGNMTELRAVKFRCDNRSCGATMVRLYIPATEDEAAMWLAGDPLPAGREARDDRDPSEN